MRLAKHRFDIARSLRCAGLVLLVSIVIVQFVAHSAMALPAQSDMHHAAPVSADCPTHALSMPGSGDPAPAPQHHGDGHDSASHCMPSMCCFHDSSMPLHLATSGVLVACIRGMDRGVKPASYIGSAKDRPPRHI